MKKRNKRTDLLAHMELAPLTEQILAKMGREGDNIRKRLTFFYLQRANRHECCTKELSDGPS